MNTHSPLPWKLDVRPKGELEIQQSNGVPISVMAFILAHTEANAQFIVTACNSHQALVDALRLMLEENAGSDSNAIRAARAALALAKGEQK